MSHVVGLQECPPLQRGLCIQSGNALAFRSFRRAVAILVRGLKALDDLPSAEAGGRAAESVSATWALLPFQKTSSFKHFYQVLRVGDRAPQQVRDTFHSQGLIVRRTRQMGDDFNAAQGSHRWHSNSWLEQIKANEKLPVNYNLRKLPPIIYSKNVFSTKL
jgi:hypothetical protein